jgi:hypothetical protein
VTERKDFEWLRELCCSERDEVDGWSSLSAADRARLERLDAELFGLVAGSLEPVEPTGVCKESLMSRCTARSEPARFGPVPAGGGRSRRWLLPLAAGVTALAVGYAVSMVGTVRGQHDELLLLRGAAGRLTALEAELATTRDAMRLVSSRGVAVCPLRPLPASADAEGPYGVLFVAADHQHWYLRVAGLDPAADGYYRVWFETAGGMVAAGNLAGSELELGSPTMPEGTRAVAVSLETEPAPGAPSDQIVLYGNDMVTVL